jgi:M6 family metalloprotease-like protein
MSRRILMVVILLCCALPASPALAGPVLPDAVTLTQPDGAPLAALPFGDEWSSGYETLDGFTVVRDETSGYWSYAVRAADGRLAGTGLIAGRDAPVGLDRHLRAAAPDRSPRINTLQPGLAASGIHPTLVLLVAFTDRGPVGSSAADWANHFFGPSQSAKHYYESVSYGRFALGPARETHGVVDDGIVGWLTLNYPHPNTQDNTGNANKQITRDAILAADPFVNFAAYDTDHDGYIATQELHIVIIVAGYETSYGGPGVACSPSVWGHQWALGSGVAAPQVDGVTVAGAKGGYAQFGEWHCSATDRPGHMATMGIMVHELGHDINWPDLYDVDYSSNGVGFWSIMSGGSWLALPGAYPGSMPPHPDAFLKWYQGWLTPTQIVGTQGGVQIEQAETAPRAIQLLNNPNGVDWVFNTRSGSGEYFLVENRQRVGYDAALPGCGLLIWHIDETRTSSNMANASDTRRLVDLEEADGRRDLDTRANKGDAGDPYPGTSNNTSFTFLTNPNSKLYNGLVSGVGVSNISACAGVMSADMTTTGAVATATATRTRTPTGTPTLKPTRTPGGPWWSIALPVVLLNNPPPLPTATPTRTPTATQTPKPTGWQTILNETFEGEFPGVWRVYDRVPNIWEYYWGKRNCRAFGGQYSAWAVGGGTSGRDLACGAQYPNAATSVMEYGPFNLADATRAEVRLKTWIQMENWYDRLCLTASANGQDFSGPCLQQQTQVWFDWGLDLSNVGGLGNLIGQPQVWIRIEFISDEDTNEAEGVYVDNVVIRKCVDSNCPDYAPGDDGDHEDADKR